MATAVADVAAARREYLDESEGRYVHVIADGSVQVNPPDSVESDYGSYDTSTIDKSVRAVVSVTFKVN